jgi:hypothetical protein
MTTMACWYPQMGGYSGKAVAVSDDTGCVDLYVWHDGEFPFTGDDDGPAPPVEVHHCDPEQFIQFGRQLTAFIDAADGQPCSTPAAPEV